MSHHHTYTATDSDPALDTETDTHAPPAFFSGGYSAVLTDPEPQQAGSSSSSAPTPASIVNEKTATAGEKGAMTDGVFSNLGVVAASFDEATSKTEPPMYREVFTDNVTIQDTGDAVQPPHYMDAGVTVAGFVVEDGDVLVDGMPVGDFFAFFANLFVSMSFDFIGFMMTTMLATSHAARCGARSGLGVTFMRYGMIVLDKDAEAEDITARYNPEDYDRVEQIAKHNDMIAYIMILFGAFLMVRANADYVKAVRVRNVMLAAAESNA
ncbi:hypothetical protein BJ741DRAFT_604520 [Chytriomyces cf. hyalinus JEL632]|nr:hypothetical protein BJ741DRAFT_604520 [Chytriomyces cf. hyalinus JEL632]